MKITIECESPEEEKNNKFKKVVIKGADTGMFVARCMEGGVVQKEHSHSWGPELSWLVGRTYVALQTLTQMYGHTR